MNHAIMDDFLGISENFSLVKKINPSNGKALALTHQVIKGVFPWPRKFLISNHPRNPVAKTSLNTKVMARRPKDPRWRHLSVFSFRMQSHPRFCFGVPRCFGVLTNLCCFAEIDWLKSLNPFVKKVFCWEGFFEVRYAEGWRYFTKFSGNAIIHAFTPSDLAKEGRCRSIRHTFLAGSWSHEPLKRKRNIIYQMLNSDSSRYPLFSARSITWRQLIILLKISFRYFFVPQLFCFLFCSVGFEWNF